MIKKQLEQLILDSLKHLQINGHLNALPPIVHVDLSKDKKHGDYATNIALVLAKSNNKKPIEMAQLIVAAIPDVAYIDKIEIAGVGFINFFLPSNTMNEVVKRILIEGSAYGTSKIGNQKKSISGVCFL